MKRTLIITASVIVALCSAVFYNAHIQRKRDLAPIEDGPLAHVELKNAEPPMEVRLHVVDLDSKPIGRVLVNSRNNSGDNMSVTDESGFARIPVAEKDVKEVWLGTNRVLNRPRAYRLGYPTAEFGLDVFVRVKDASKIDRASESTVEFYKELESTRSAKSQSSRGKADTSQNN